MIKNLMMIAMLTAFAQAVFAANTYYVAVNDPNASDTANVGTKEIPFKTIQAAIDKAASGDTVEVAPGVYSNSVKAVGSNRYRLYISNKVISLNGTEGAANTIIEGVYDETYTTGGGGTAGVGGIYFNAAAGTIVRGFTLTKCTVSNGSRGSAVYNNNNSPDVYVADCVFINNYSYYALSREIIFVRCQFLNNNAVCHPVGWHSVFIDSIIAGNKSSGSYAPSDDGKFYNCSIIDNIPNGTLPSTGGSSAYYNCLITTSTGTNSTGSDPCYNCINSNTEGVGRYHAISPFFNDFRLMTGSAAIGAGNADWREFTLPTTIDTGKDIYGNDIPMSGAMNVGAIQATVTAKGAGFYANANVNYALTLNGEAPTIQRTYHFGEVWPTQYVVKVTHVNGLEIFGIQRTSTDATTTTWQFPRLSGDFLFTPAPEGGAETLTPQAVAKTLWLAPDGSDSNDGSESAPLATFQGAADKVAVDYTLIKVKPGEYSDGGSGYARLAYTKSYPIAFRSVEGAKVTLHVGGELKRCVNVGGTYSSTFLQMQGVTLTGGYMTGDNSGAAFLGNDKLCLSDCIISNNYTVSGVVGSSAVLERCFVCGNMNDGASMFASCTYSSCIIVSNITKSASATVFNDNTILNQSTVADNILAGSLVNGILAANNSIVTGPGNGTLSISGYGNVVYGFDTVTGSGYVETDPLFSDAAKWDYRPFAGSPAIGGGELPTAENYGADSTFYNYAAGDFNGVTNNFFENVGAYQIGFPFGYKIVDEKDLFTIEGVSEKTKVLEPGESAQFAITRNANAKRYSTGFYVNGEYKAWADATGGRYIFDVNGADSSVVIVSVYTKEWYVSPSGDDNNDGFTTNTPMKTIMKAMSVAEADDTVLAAAGTYGADEAKAYATATEETNKVYSRVVVKEGVTLQSMEGEEVTFIVGEAAPVSTYATSPGLGTNAVRCVWLKDGAKIKGFTIMGGYTQTQERTDRNYGATYLQGGGVNGVANSLCQNCVISNCCAHFGSAGANVVFNRCKFINNVSGRGSCIGVIYGKVLNSIFDKNTSATAGDYLTYSSSLVMNCTFTYNNRYAGGSDRQTYPVYSTASTKANVKFYNNLVLCSTHTSADWNGDNRYTTYTIQPTIGGYKWRNLPESALGEGSILTNSASLDIDSTTLVPIPGAETPFVCGNASWELYDSELAKIAILAGEESVVDLEGISRHQNGGIDRGCYSYDWLAKYKEDMTESKAMKVESASWNVKENDDEKVQLTPDTEVKVLWTNAIARKVIYSHTITLTGGAMFVYVNGELKDTITTANKEIVFDLENDLVKNEITFAFAGSTGDIAILGTANMDDSKLGFIIMTR